MPERSDAWALRRNRRASRKAERAQSTLQPLGQEAQQPWRQEARVAVWLLDRIAEPIMRRAVHHAAAGVEARLLERQQELERLGPVVDHVVLGAPAEKDRGLGVGDDRMADRRGFEIAAAILHRR